MGKRPEENFKELKKQVQVGEKILDKNKQYFRTFNKGKKYLLVETEENFLNYIEILNDIYKENNKENLLSFSFFENEVARMLMDDINVTYVIIVDFFRNLNKIEYIFIKPLHGAVLCDMNTLVLGNYTFIKKEYIQAYIENIDSDFLKTNDCFTKLDKDRCHCYVEVKCYAKEPKRAKEIADDECRVLDNSLRFLIGTLDPRLSIGTDYISSSEFCEILSFSSCGQNKKYYGLDNAKSFMPIYLEDANYFSEEVGKPILEMISKETLNGIEKRLKTAINWVGMARNQQNEAIAFIQCMFALEGLLQEQTDLISKSITALLSEYAAFLLGNTIEERCIIEKNVKRLYGTRSKIAHGELVMNIHEELEMIFSYTQRIVRCFFSNEKLRGMSTMQDLHKYISNLRYSVNANE